MQFHRNPLCGMGLHLTVCSLGHRRADRLPISPGSVNHATRLFVDKVTLDPHSAHNAAAKPAGRMTTWPKPLEIERNRVT